MCETFIKEYSDTATARRDSIIPSLHNAIVLLFFALGSCKSFSDSPKPSSIIPGMAYYFRAQDILAHKREKYSTSFAQAMTLAALYTNQIGNLQESWLHISCAYSLYKQHGYYRSVPNDVSTVRSQNNPISEETKRGSWICRELERGIDALLNIVSSDLIPISGSNILPVESPEEGPEMFCANRALLQTLLEEVQKLTPTGFAENTTMDKEDLTYLTNAANSQLEYLKIWRSGLPSSLAWEDRKPPSIDPLMASLQAEFYNGIAKLLRPYLEIIRKCERFAGTLNKLSAGQRGLIGVVESWIQGALSSIVAFDRIGAVSDGVYEEYRSTNKIPIVLSNPVKTLHAEFENVLILHAVYFSAIYPLLSAQTGLTETSLNALRVRTIDRLSGFWPKSPLLTRDLKILGMLKQKGDSVALLELAGIMTGRRNDKISYPLGQHAGPTTSQRFTQNRVPVRSFPTKVKWGGVAVTAFPRFPLSSNIRLLPKASMTLWDLIGWLTDRIYGNNGRGATEEKAALQEISEWAAKIHGDLDADNKQRRIFLVSLIGKQVKLNSGAYLKLIGMSEDEFVVQYIVGKHVELEDAQPHASV
ncbi:hypothetical protein PtrSN002B_010964 [Pyrenophora tritici-repentis]|nr:hypothetical protein PtrSN002B_010964 [Pyrenophora tritici-repentis]